MRKLKCISCDAIHHISDKIPIDESSTIICGCCGNTHNVQKIIKYNEEITKV